MAEENEDGQEKTEDPTEERRETARRQGDLAVSRELVSVFVLMTSLGFIGMFLHRGVVELLTMYKSQLSLVGQREVSLKSVGPFLSQVWYTYLKIVCPFFIFTVSVASLVTLIQTRFNFTLERLSFNLKRVDPLSGMKRLFSSQSLMELVKAIAKMLAVGAVAYLVLYSEWHKMPGLLNLPIASAWILWLKMQRWLVISVVALLLLIAAADYFYTFQMIENRLKMTKQEVKEEYKQREIDPQIKNRMRRMAREMANRKTLKSTREATVLITNPTHYSIALKYEVGMSAPIMLAKGVDLMALEMRKIAKEMDIPIVENVPLARTLYQITDEGDEIPESLYQAVSEVIRYVFKKKGIKIGRN